MRYYYIHGDEELTPKQGVTIALGILFITGWIFFRTLRSCGGL